MSACACACLQVLKSLLEFVESLVSRSTSPQADNNTASSATESVCSAPPDLAAAGSSGADSGLTNSLPAIRPASTFTAHSRSDARGPSPRSARSARGPGVGERGSGCKREENPRPVALQRWSVLRQRVRTGALVSGAGYVMGDLVGGSGGSADGRRVSGVDFTVRCVSVS